MSDAAVLGRLLRSRRSVRDFDSRPLPETLVREVLDEARHAPSWSNTQPYRVNAYDPGRGDLDGLLLTAGRRP